MDFAIANLGEGPSSFWFSNFSNEKVIEWNFFKEKLKNFIF
jgi:hypothetical protein